MQANIIQIGANAGDSVAIDGPAALLSAQADDLALKSQRAKDRMAADEKEKAGRAPAQYREILTKNRQEKEETTRQAQFGPPR